MQKQRQCSILFFQIIIGGWSLEQEYIIGVIKFLINKPLNLNIGFGGPVANASIFNLVNLLGVIDELGLYIIGHLL